MKKADSPQLRRAKELWQQARWREAEEALATLEPGQMRGEALLLRARLLLLRDPAAAIAFAVSTLRERHSPHFRAEFLIILGNARSRIGEFEDAEKLFAEAERESGGDRDLLAKAAQYRAVSCMLQGEVDAIEPLIPAIADTQNADIRAQSAMLHAVVLRHREQYRAQIPILVRALVELRYSPMPNAWVRCSILHMLSEIVFEYWEPTLAAFVEEEVRAIEWHEEIAVWNFFISRALSWWFALCGDSFNAFRYLKRAVELPVRDSLVVLNHADRAYLARGLGEHVWAQQELTLADEVCHRTSWDSERDERDDASIAFASLAELYAEIDPARASEYLARFQMFHQRMSTANTRRHDRTDHAFVTGTKGVVNAALGKLSEAVRLLRESYDIYDEIGYDWRAGKAALALASIAGEPQYLENARKKLARYDRSWLAQSYRATAERFGFANMLPGVRLTPGQWQVFHLLADGFSLTEVAGHLGRSVNTVRNHTRAIYAELGVHSQKELRALARLKAGRGAAPSVRDSAEGSGA